VNCLIRFSGLAAEVEDEMSPPIRSLACSVICLMSEQDLVRKEVAEAGAIPSQEFQPGFEVIL